MDRDAIEQVRRFNRTVAERIGALQDEYLGRGRALGASRVLWEIGEGGTDVRLIRNRLGLDSGYLSRLLGSLKSEGLIVVESDPNDQRVRTVRLTVRGMQERSDLDRLSDDLALSLLRPLGESRARRLADAMETVTRLLTAGLVDLRVEDPASAAARFCFESYFAELDERFDTGFDPLAGISADAHELTPPAGLLLVAWLHGEPVGCGALEFHGDHPAELKRMWVSPDARRLGLGRRLLEEVESVALERGVHVLRLETNRSLSEAIALYRSAAYTEVPKFNDEPYAHHWFEKRLDP